MNNFNHQNHKMPLIDLVQPAHYESLAELLYELHAFYNDPPTATRDEVNVYLRENLLASHSGLQLVVAAKDGVVLGFAALILQYSLVEPALAQRRQCQLKELYVRASARNAGLGKALMLWVAHYALAQGCGRMDWNVKAANLRGRHFYHALGAELIADRMSLRLSKAQLEQLTAQHADEQQ